MTLTSFIIADVIIFFTLWLGLDNNWFTALFISPFAAWGCFYLFYLFIPGQETFVSRM